MTRRRLEVGFALLLSIVVAFAGFAALDGIVRDVEISTVLTIFQHFDRVSLLPGHVLQVLPAHHTAFRATVTPYCSSLISLLALGAIALCVLRGSIYRRIVAFLAAASVVLVCNVLRIAASLWAGLQFGPGGLVLFHDWVGTIFGLTYTLAGFFLMLYLLLPSARVQIPRAARVSDVL